MGIERIEAARGRALTRVKRTDRAEPGAQARRADAAPAHARTPRHALHGWRRLAGPLIVQVLQNGYEPLIHRPAAAALEAYLAQQRQTRMPIVDETA